jgi:radical SAM superfamily enzyme YgiQ (UPF0313 family)
MAVVTFVHSPDPHFAALQTTGVHFMPVWAYTLAAHLPEAGLELRLADLRVVRPDEIEAADLFLFSGINQDLGTLVALQAGLQARFPGARFVLGGPITWSFEQAGRLDELRMFEHLVIGDGEGQVADLVARLLSGQPLPRVLRAGAPFDLSGARPMHRGLLERTIGDYYGAVVEVARGCPFGCEFCDIRVLPGNNAARCKSPDLIVEELEVLSGHGVSTFLLACDNFIGNPRWAEQVVDRILAWEARTGRRPSLYTWLTVNLHRFPALLAKMRRAGFDMLFVGIESFDAQALRETSKLQNRADELVESLQRIQSYGFFVVGGLIFGFDSDREDCFDKTLDRILESGLLSGDPSLLTALPGTPLYQRMEREGRVRTTRFGLGGNKYQTNIKYLMPRQTLIDGYRRFVARVTDGGYQYARLRAYFDLLERGNYIPLPGRGFVDLMAALKTLRRDRRAIRLNLRRGALFVAKPANLYWFARGVLLALRRRHIAGAMGYVKLWWTLWSTVILKYQGLSDQDFDLESVEAGWAPPRLTGSGS